MHSASSPDRPANRLARETSPYLLQHARNPVDWYPWGEEALARAREEDKPVFLSIGYAACHWCHVMERESFENEPIAALLNEHFVAIKVDREERPDLDDIYMQAVQMLTGQGGWPMSVFLAPDGRPFYGGTYFPPDDRYGRPGFAHLLTEIARLWREDRARLLDGAEQLGAAIGEDALAAAPEGEVPGRELVERAAGELLARHDKRWGGFGGAPKFPPSMAIDLLLREHRRTRDPRLIEVAEHTLDAMARGGLYDQLGGGFHRYSVDAEWLVPHFEKMLYDNALLATVYAEAWRATGRERWRRVTQEALDYVLREMTGAEGCFHATQDADSEGVEGRFYIWTPGEIDEILGAEEGELAREYFGVVEGGNWHEADGASVLNVPVPTEEFAAARGLAPEELERRLSAARARLLAARGMRVWPGKDDKVIAGWNGLMITAMARGTQITGDPRYANAGRRAAQFIFDHMHVGGALAHVWRHGTARFNAFLDDYAHLINGLVDLYETLFDPALIDRADMLASEMINRFYDPEGGGFFSTDGLDPTLVARLKDFYDGATPSGNASAVHALLRLGALVDRDAHREAAENTLRAARERLTRMAAAHHHMLCALDSHHAPLREIAIAGEPADPRARRLIESVWRHYLPERVLAAGQPFEGATAIAILRDRPMRDGLPTAYVCINRACREPVHEPKELEALLD